MVSAHRVPEPLVRFIGGLLYLCGPGIVTGGILLIAPDMDGFQILSAAAFVVVFDLGGREAVRIWRRRAPVPLPGVLHCPACGLQHIDEPNLARGWHNPPHRSHECQGCGHVWRPFDVPTTGVRGVRTRGRADSPGGPEPVS